MNPELLDRLPPTDREAERATVGSALLKPSCLEDLAGIVQPADFHDAACGVTYAVLCSMAARSMPIDAITLAGELKTQGKIDVVGGVPFLVDIARSVPTAYHAEHYAARVARCSRLRGIIDAALTAVQEAYDPTADPREVADILEESLRRLDAGLESDDPVTADEAATEALADIRRAQQGRSGGVLTGLSGIDEQTGGMFPGELIIVAARPGVGKTSLACQIAHHVACRDRPVLVASLEMRARELATRVLCGIVGVSSKLVRAGNVSEQQLEVFEQAANEYRRIPFYVIDRPRLSVATIRRQARRLARKGLSLVVVDYLQLVDPPNRRVQRHEQIGDITRELKAIAGELSVPVMCLCQLNRDADKEGVPRLWHLKESGSIEQDADMAGLLYLGEWKEADNYSVPTERQANFAIAKNRNGEIGNVKLEWIKERTLFRCPTFVGHSEFAGFGG